jgi:hypothetical protein
MEMSGFSKVVKSIRPSRSAAMRALSSGMIGTSRVSTFGRSSPR